MDYIYSIKIGTCISALENDVSIRQCQPRFLRCSEDSKGNQLILTKNMSGAGNTAVRVIC